MTLLLDSVARDVLESLRTNDVRLIGCQCYGIELPPFETNDYALVSSGLGCKLLS